MVGVHIVKLQQAETCNFTKSNSPPWLLFTILKLYKWYQIVQSVTNGVMNMVSETAPFAMAL